MRTSRIGPSTSTFFVSFPVISVRQNTALHVLDILLHSRMQCLLINVNNVIMAWPMTFGYYWIYFQGFFTTQNLLIQTNIFPLATSWKKHPQTLSKSYFYFASSLYFSKYFYFVLSLFYILISRNFWIIRLFHMNSGFSTEMERNKKRGQKETAPFLGLLKIFYFTRSVSVHLI